MKSPSTPSISNGLTLRTKMALLSATAFAGILFVTLISLFLMHEVRVGGPAYRSIQKNKDALESIALLKSDLFQINSEVQNLMIEADASAARKNIATIENLINDIELNFGIVLESIESAKKKDAINKAEVIWKEYQKTLQAEVLPAAARGDVKRAGDLMAAIQARRFSTFSKAIAQMVDITRQDVSAAEERVAASIRIKMIMSGVVTLAVFCLVALFSYLITISITRPLGACVAFARSVAGGKLDERLKVRGGGEAADLAGAMNIMVENLHSMVSRISSAADVLSAIDNNIEKASRHVVVSASLQETAVRETSEAVDGIKATAMDVADGIEKLASSATETSSSSLEMAASIEEVALSADKLSEAVDEVTSSIMEMATSIKQIGSSIINLQDASNTTSSSISEMDATIRQVEKNALDTSAISEGVRKDAETGKRAVEEAMAGMQAIRESSRITAEVIENLSLRANDIGTILSVIDEVAEQTNLLALNAAIIAAQAGEHGKGFAVVADEIRELAERTSSSTREIATVIRGVQEETNRAVNAINMAEESISEGEKLSERSGAALEKIVSGVQKASIQVAEIARATVEQAYGSQSIKEAMESVAEMVEHIASSANEHALTSEQIAKAVERMKDLTVHVRISTREQSRTSSLIAHAIENSNLMVEQVRNGCHIQAMNSDTITAAVQNIRKSTASNTEMVRVLEGSVTGLSKQISLLEKEMSRFKI
ncbi:methyl-accepting chemotaxis protein [Geobacter sp. SVR]|uniref:methyl-accepting chemotaxis protein n=1 Tax=Geobacter sp. SVR TaxID=2495594 RepID=UPI00143F0459|nr:HAMP domain-containing methyl-accepting chemotaxis protein [Geobacter sp. SVR]BCS52986.1 methyl-accepting chemotaxis protein [Geobacter sp. SVR]GCF84370.1 methyl-accepting chemotaxis protein [Geobacter sp. SVR]